MPNPADEIREMQKVTEEVADQTVYVYRGKVLIDHFPPSTRWDLVEEPSGLACHVWVWSVIQNRMVLAKVYPPGEWTFCGRGGPE